MTGTQTRAWAPYLLVGVVALAPFLTSLSNGFALDDVPAVQQDERIRSLSGVPSLFSEPYLTYMPVERSPYRPITTVSYSVSWAVGGGAPWAFHLTNVALHAAAALALLSVLLALGAPVGAGLVASLVFATHPVHVEAVAGVVGRADVLATLFGLLALRTWVSPIGRSWLGAGAVGAFYLLALASKEGAVVLPLLLILVGWVRFGSPAVRRALPSLITMTMALIGFLSVRAAVLGGVVQLDVASYIAPLPSGLRVTTAVANFVELLRLLVFPLNLSPEYGPGLILPTGAGEPRFWAGLAVLIGLAGAGAWGLFATRRGVGPAGSRGHAPRPEADPSPAAWIGLGAAWVLIGYLLVSNLALPMPMWIAERTLYLSSAGLSLMIVGAVTGLGLLSDARRRRTMVVTAVLVLISTVHAADRSMVWADDETLFVDLAERHPESFRAQWWIGGRFVDGGDLERGVTWLERAHQTNPNGALLALDYARALLLVNRAVEAEEVVRPIPIFLHPSQPVFLAQSLIVQGRRDEAAVVVREGLRAHPTEARLRDQARQLGIDEA